MKTRLYVGDHVVHLRDREQAVAISYNAYMQTCRTGCPTPSVLFAPSPPHPIRTLKVTRRTAGGVACVDAAVHRLANHHFLHALSKLISPMSAKRTSENSAGSATATRTRYPHPIESCLWCLACRAGLGMSATQSPRHLDAAQHFDIYITKYRDTCSIALRCERAFRHAYIGLLLFVCSWPFAQSGCALATLNACACHVYT